MTPLIPWLWRGYVRPWRLVILAALALMSLEGGMLGLLSWAVGPMFDRIFVGGDKGAIPLVAGGILAIFLVRAGASFGQRVLMSLVGQSVAARLQADLVAHLVRLDSAFFTLNPPGTLIERVRGDTQAAAGLPASVIASIGRDGVALLSLFAVALSIDWVWTLIAVAAAPLLTLPAAALQRRVTPSSRQARVTAARLSTRLDEIFHGINAIKLSGTEARESRRYADEIAGFVRSQVRSEGGQAGIPALMDVVAGIGFLGVLSYGGAQIIAGTKTVGDFMSFFTAMALVFEPLRRLGNVSGAWAAARTSLERLHDLFALAPTILSPAQPRALPVPAAQADITLTDVHFSYGESPVLNGLSFTARAGRTTAIVGPSGAGKSTVFNLLARLIEPQSGQVALAGVPVADLPLDQLRGIFSVVAQDAALFDETLRDNILMGATVPAAALDDAARAAHVTDFAQALPQGFDTAVGPARLGAVGRPAPARRHRPGAAARPPGAAVRRGDLGARRRLGGGGAGGAGTAVGASHHAGDRPPAGDDPQCRQHRGDGPWPLRRSGQPRGSAGPRRPLCRALPDAVRRGLNPGARVWPRSGGFHTPAPPWSICGRMKGEVGGRQILRHRPARPATSSRPPSPPPPGRCAASNSPAAAAIRPSRRACRRNASAPSRR